MNQHIPFPEWLAMKQEEALRTMPHDYAEMAEDLEVVEALDEQGFVE